MKTPPMLSLGRALFQRQYTCICLAIALSHQTYLDLLLPYQVHLQPVAVTCVTERCWHNTLVMGDDMGLGVGVSNTVQGSIDVDTAV